ncbi:hypothetical protein FLAG1_07118 [Fusarium langsethiae]|uniref:Uncharacterized protein n=1 Tax=Fusarium langsethiae TaxID=179993 RepID=A0A0M9EU91_FUSLA|nr:hypothetical protein FLAG1_07118 [Fusarium langsethiae]GKU04419.1 unnamed protein product [Fusarium langsethiae]GKU20183.1 unnamed protein product [Fusarium langsethiae]
MMVGQYHSVPSNGQHDIHLQFQNPPTSTPSPSPSPSPSLPTRRFQGLPARRRSKVKLWLGLIGKWFITIIFIIVVYIILVAYALHDVISEKQKKYFNALITGFLIALGLSTMSQLTHAVQDLRWWILSKRPRSRQKVKAILQVHSMSQVLVLAFKSSRWTIHVGVATWVALFLATQIGYASLGLCYSVEKTEDQALMVPGNVSIANLSSISTSSIVNASGSAKAEEYAANSYGIISLALNEGDFDDIPTPGTLFFADNKFLFCDGNCSYIFRETNTLTLDNPIRAPVAASTDRKVNITTHCKALKIRQGGNGTGENITIEDGRRETNIALPIKEALGEKVYMTSASYSCGKDCSIVSVFEPSSTDPWFYNCTVKMSPVENAKRPEHQVGERLARLATSAIALGGPDGANDTRSNSYPAASIFGMPLNGSTEGVEYLLSRFATGVLAAVIESNADIVLPGEMPTVGQKLNVSHWGIITLILWVTAFLQLLVAVVATKVSERVVVPEGDSLSEAKVLRAMVEEDMLDEEMKDSRKGKSLWIYRSRHMGDGLYDLYMEEVKT